jgi:excisionase family DNA binding protein
MSMLESFLTAEEVAGLLKVQKKTVYAWAERGKIPAYKINKALRFRESDLREFIEESRILLTERRSQAKVPALGTR